MATRRVCLSAADRPFLIYADCAGGIEIRQLAWVADRGTRPECVFPIAGRWFSISARWNQPRPTTR